MEGLDATAARTFGTIANQLHSLRIDLLITGVHKAAVRRLLVAHGVICEVCRPLDLVWGLVMHDATVLAAPRRSGANICC